MAQTHIVVERYVNGSVVSTETITRPLEDVNEETLRERARTAIGNNADFLAIASPTNAQAVAQVRALTRQVDALIRLQERLLGSIDDA